MPRARHARGRPGTAVIPGDWETTHGAVVVKTLTATVELRRPGTRPVWNPVTEQTEQQPRAPYWTGPARVQALRATARTITVAEDRTVTADYLVVLPHDVDTAASRDMVRVTTGSGDPALDGRDLQVEEVAVGTERFERDLYCTL